MLPLYIVACSQPCRRRCQCTECACPSLWRLSYNPSVGEEIASDINAGSVKPRVSPVRAVEVSGSSHAVFRPIVVVRRPDDTLLEFDGLLGISGIRRCLPLLRRPLGFVRSLPRLCPRNRLSSSTIGSLAACNQRRCRYSCASVCFTQIL